MLVYGATFILAILLTSVIVACEDDKKETEESCLPHEVSGGEVSGGSVEQEDMGLEGGQPSEQEVQPTGGSEADPEDPQGGEQEEDLPVGGSEEQSGGEAVEDPIEGGSLQEPTEGGTQGGETELDCAPEFVTEEGCDEPTPAVDPACEPCEGEECPEDCDDSVEPQVEEEEGSEG